MFRLNYFANMAVMVTFQRTAGTVGGAAVGGAAVASSWFLLEFGDSAAGLEAPFFQTFTQPEVDLLWLTACERSEPRKRSAGLKEKGTRLK